MTQYPLRSVLTGLMIGTAGGAVAHAAGFPAGWMIGASTAVALARLMGVRSSLPALARDISFASIGLGIGAGVSAETFASAAAWWPSLIGVVLSTAAIMVLATGLIRLVGRLDPLSARLAAIPGTVAHVITVAIEGGGRTADIMLIQSLRLLMLTLALPLVLDVSVDAGMPRPPALGWLPTALLLAAALPCAMLLKRWGIAAAQMLSGFAVSATAHATGLVDGPLPEVMTAAVYVTTGIVIGQTFRPIRLAELGRLVPAGLLAVALAGAIAAAVAEVLALTTGLPFGLGWLAFAPGGVQAMPVIALALGYDPTFVAAHHILRVALLAAVVPFWARR